MMFVLLVVTTLAPRFALQTKSIATTTPANPRQKITAAATSSLTEIPAAQAPTADEQATVHQTVNVMPDVKTNTEMEQNSNAKETTGDMLAATPPMGWNSWDAFGTGVREESVKANADYMARHLAKYGWQYIVVDIQWYEPNAKSHDYLPGARVVLDEYGRLLPAENRFPSAANGAGLKPLADYVHGKGLKLGIHIMRGIPRQAVAENLAVKGSDVRASAVADKDNACRWNADMWGVDTTKPGAQAYYDSIAELYASWGIDFIKADDMASHLYQPAEIKALSQAIRKTGRPMVLSLSPGPAPITEADFFGKYAQMWRISDDFWDKWPSLKAQFGRARDWAASPRTAGRPGAWPDADMLPLGRAGRMRDGGRPSRVMSNTP